MSSREPWRSDRACGVQVNPVGAGPRPARVRIDASLDDVVGEHLDRGARVIPYPHSRIDDRLRAKVLGRPTHARELLRGNGEPDDLPVQLRLHLEAAAYLGSVVLADIADDLRREVRERDLHSFALEALSLNQALASFEPVGALGLIIWRLPQRGRREGEQSVDTVTGGEEVIETDLLAMRAPEGR